MDKEEKAHLNRQLVIKIFIFLTLVAVIILQVKATKLIAMNMDKLDADPFSYGANKYNIESADCFLSSGDSLYFNKTSSKFIINKYKEVDLNGLES